MDLFIIYIISHLIGDFILQPRWMGENKSKDWMTLVSHVSIYTTTMIMLPSAISLGLYKLGWTELLPGWASYWALASLFLGHFFTDVWTSKLSSHFYSKYLETKKKKHLNYFWWIIGLDQTIHVIHLYLTFKYLIL